MWSPADEGYGMNMGMHMGQTYDPFQYNFGGDMGGPDMMMNMNMHPGDMNWGNMMNWGGYGGFDEYGLHNGPPHPPQHAPSNGVNVDGGDFDPRRQRSVDYYGVNRFGEGR